MPQRPPIRPPAISGFTWLRPLGSGGFAEVFLYEQDMPRRPVAVKVFPPVGLGDSERVAFETEADITARLSHHPSMLTVFQASISSDGHPYLALEYCPDSMGVRAKAGRIPVDTVLDTGVRLAGALETAHRSGLLHRDIKPANVLVNALGRPVLSDFGIATGPGITDRADGIAMSVPWAAPELVAKQHGGTVASEIWSLAATLFHFAAGRSPFELPDRADNSREKLESRISRARYPGLPEETAPAGLDAVLEKAMRLRPEERYASMREFGEALRAVQLSEGEEATTLEVGNPEWADLGASAAPAGTRGPVISRVRSASRSAKRKAEHSAEEPWATPPAAPRRLTPLPAALLGAGAAAVVILGSWALWGGVT